MSEPRLTADCGVCTAPASAHQHYGAVSCYPCRSFFKRSIGMSYICVRENNSCEVDKINRKSCPKCRFDKCLSVGMLPQLVGSYARNKQFENITEETRANWIQPRSRIDIQKPECNNLEKYVGNTQRHGIPVSVIKAVDDTVNNVQSEKLSDKLCDDPDIETLNAESFPDEQQEDKSNIETKSQSSYYSEQSVNDFTVVLPYKKRQKLHFEHHSNSASELLEPIVGFTFEEEFRLHDLLARRDHISAVSFKHFQTVSPSIIQKWVEQIKKTGKVAYTEEILDLAMGPGREIGCLLVSEGYEECTKLGKCLAYRCAFISSAAGLVLALTTMNAREEHRLRSQKPLHGKSGNAWLSVWEDNKMAQMVQSDEIKPPKNLLLFESPWAQSLKEELFYEQTLRKVGQYIEGDLKLSHLYNMLIFATPPEGSILSENVQLMKLKSDLALLLYRYLASKIERTKAAEQAHSLMGMIGKLHRCGDILLSRKTKTYKNNFEVDF